MKPQDLIGEVGRIVDADDHSITFETWDKREQVTGTYTIMLTIDEVLVVVEV